MGSEEIKRIRIKWTEAANKEADRLLRSWGYYVPGNGAGGMRYEGYHWLTKQLMSWGVWKENDDYVTLQVSKEPIEEQPAFRDYFEFRAEVVTKTARNHRWMEKWLDPMCYSERNRRQLANILLWVCCRDRHRRLRAGDAPEGMRTAKPVAIYINMLKSCFREIRKEAQLEDVPKFDHRYFSEEELALAYDHREIGGDSYLLHLALRRRQTTYERHLLATTGSATQKERRALRQKVRRERQGIYFLLRQRRRPEGPDAARRGEHLEAGEGGWEWMKGHWAGEGSDDFGQEQITDLMLSR